MMTTHLRSSVVLLLGTLIGGAFAYFSVALSARLLGTAEFGLLGAMIGVVSLAGVVLRPANIVVTHLAATARARQDMAGIRGLTGPALLISAGFGILMLAVTLLASSALGRFFQTDGLWPLVLLPFLITGVLAAQITTGLIYGLQRFPIIALATVLEALVRALLTFPLVLVLGVAGSLSSYFGGLIMTSTVAVACVGGLAWRMPPTAQLRESLRIGGASLTLTLAAALIQNGDLVLLRSYANPQDVGLYAAAASVGNILFLLLAPLYLPAFPKVIAAHMQGRPTWPILRAVLLLIGAIGAGAVMSAAWLGTPATVLMFGPRFSGVGEYLPAYLAKITALLVLGTLGQHAIAVGQPRGPYVAVIIAGLATSLVVVLRPPVLGATFLMLSSTLIAAIVIAALMISNRSRDPSVPQSALDGEEQDVKDQPKALIR